MSPTFSRSALTLAVLLAGASGATAQNVGSYGRAPRPDTRLPHVIAHRTSFAKCDRCWRHRPEVEAEVGLCGRCADVVDAEVAGE